MAGKTINVSHYVTDHGGTYIIVWRDDQTELVARHCCQWAADRQLDFNWRDAAYLMDYADCQTPPKQTKGIKQWLKKLWGT